MGYDKKFPSLKVMKGQVITVVLENYAVIDDRNFEQGYVGLAP